jgi:glycosyltransferase involved in cell wall biosynthesis
MLASLIKQTYRNFDVVVYNDGSQQVGTTQSTDYNLACLKAGGMREVWLEEGSHISQAHNHNLALYDPAFRDYKYFVRMDDDVLLNAFALERMLNTIIRHGAAAVGGLWFENEFAAESLYDRMVAEVGIAPPLDGKCGPFNSNWQQRVYHSVDELMRVEHVYSVCIYDTEKMRQAGGWPEVYGRGVAHGEETDGTFRLHLTGEDLYINPCITGEHLRAGSGGIRSVANLQQIQAHDLRKWQIRLPDIKRINFKPTVAVECRHSYGLGGAERLFYHTVHLLQQSGKFEVVHPIFPSVHFSPDEVMDAFGFSYEDAAPLDEYDVLIVIGHEPQHITKAKHKIFYCLFPIPTVSRADLIDFDLILGISGYTAEWIREWWKYNVGYIYPPVEPIGFDPEEKENIILMVGRCVPHKNPLWLMQKFMQWKFHGWELHFVSATCIADHAAYEADVLEYAAKHDNIVVHQNISINGVEMLYRRSKILWAANGMLGKLAQQAEHFGYTPVEAWGAGCIPIVYNRGGHKETVDSPFRWSTESELLIATEISMGSFGKIDNVVDMSRFDPDEYALVWEQYIRRVNAMALELPMAEVVEVEARAPHIAMITDSPYFPEHGTGVSSGFGVVAGQIARRFLEEKYRLSILGMMDHVIPKSSQPLPFDLFPTIGDPEALRIIPMFLNWAKPYDVIFMLYDPGGLLPRIETFQNTGMAPEPVIAYFPVEGANTINASIPGLIERVHFPVVYCESAKRLIQQYVSCDEIYVAPHGIDHAKFGPPPARDRNRVRELVDWDNRFIVMAVGTNKRVKNHPVLIKAIRILMGRGYDDISLYLHTTKDPTSPYLAGWNLKSVIDQESARSGLEVARHIYMPIHDPYHGAAYKWDDLDIWRMTRPSTADERKGLFNALDFITRYQIADLYVDISGAEGFGLPPLEAAACGVPVVSIDDGMVRSEIHSKYCHMIEPDFWTEWHTGTMLAGVFPEELADEIEDLYHDRKFMHKFDAAQAGIMEDLPWRKSTDVFVGLVEKAVAISRTT